MGDTAVLFASRGLHGSSVLRAEHTTHGTVRPARPGPAHSGLYELGSAPI